MPPRTAKQILAEWHDLAMQRMEVDDRDIAEGLAARIEQLRREYIEGTPPEPRTELPSTARDNEPKVQMKFDWLTKAPGRDATGDRSGTPHAHTKNDP